MQKFKLLITSFFIVAFCAISENFSIVPGAHASKNNKNSIPVSNDNVSNNTNSKSIPTVKYDNDEQQKADYVKQIYENIKNKLTGGIEKLTNKEKMIAVVFGLLILDKANTLIRAKNKPTTDVILSPKVMQEIESITKDDDELLDKTIRFDDEVGKKKFENEEEIKKHYESEINKLDKQLEKFKNGEIEKEINERVKNHVKINKIE